MASGMLCSWGWVAVNRAVLGGRYKDRFIDRPGAMVWVLMAKLFQVDSAI